MAEVSSVAAPRAPGVAAELVESLKQLIRDGAYRPGDRLPSERALSDEFGVSRPTVREALQALAAMKVVEQRHGSGVYVAPLAVYDLLEPVRFALELNEPRLASLFEIRLALEPIAARLAAARATDEEVEELWRIVEAAGRPRVSQARFVELDTELHDLVLRAARDDLLRSIVSSLGVLSRKSRQRTVRQAGVRNMTVRDHRAVVGAIDAGDGIAAARAMTRHIERVRRASRAAR
jgi:GntR family transcriptional repressor for pyruvate dehydrogenase complex